MKDAIFAARRVACISRVDHSVMLEASRGVFLGRTYGPSSMILRTLHAVAKIPRRTRKMSVRASRVGVIRLWTKESGARARMRSVAVPTLAFTYWLLRTVRLAVHTASRCGSSIHM